MKLRKITISILAVAMLLTAFAIPASAANTSDDYLRLDMYKIDYTGMRKKDNNTPVYLKNQEYTLPYNGYYVQTQYGNSETAYTLYAASYGPYRINTYSPRTIRSNAAGKSLAGYWVRIRGDYKDTAYNGGWVDIAWSPDTNKPENYVSLN